MGSSENGILHHLTAQVADVNQPLLAVRKVMKAGNRVVFDDDFSYIEDKKSGEILPMGDDGSMFLLKLWCRRPIRADGDAASSDVADIARSSLGFPRQE